jgi:UDP:flavonoid glycosyltransferase YjiC (YdhE family)
MLRDAVFSRAAKDLSAIAKQYGGAAAGADLIEDLLK